MQVIHCFWKSCAQWHVDNPKEVRYIIATKCYVNISELEIIEFS